MFFDYRDMLDNRDKFKINIEICLTLSSHTSNNYSMHSSVTNMLNRMHWTTLQVRRENLRLIMIYKLLITLLKLKQGTHLLRTVYPPEDIQIDSGCHLPELIHLVIPSILMQLNCGINYQIL